MHITLNKKSVSLDAHTSGLTSLYLVCHDTLLKIKVIFLESLVPWRTFNIHGIKMFFRLFKWQRKTKKNIILLNIFHRKVLCGTNNGSSTASLRKPYFETFIF